MLDPKGLAVEGKVHLEGQPIHKAAQEAEGKELSKWELRLGGAASNQQGPFPPLTILLLPSSQEVLTKFSGR